MCVPHPMLVGGTGDSPSEAAGTHTASLASMWCVLRCPPLHRDHLVKVPRSPFTAGQHWDSSGRIHLPSVRIFWLTPLVFPPSWNLSGCIEGLSARSCTGGLSART